MIVSASWCMSYPKHVVHSSSSSKPRDVVVHLLGNRRAQALVVRWLAPVSLEVESMPLLRFESCLTFVAHLSASRSVSVCVRFNVFERWTFVS